MSFVYPGFLFALAAISIPIIIHLFNFRRYRKVYFSDIRFLKNVEMQTRSRNELRHLLVLLARILAIACMVLAFAQPFIPVGGDDGATAADAVTIYVDNSFSMTADGEQGMLLDEARAKALEVAEAHAQGNRISLLTNDFDPRHQRPMSLAEFKTELAAVAPSPVVRKMSEVVMRASTGRGADERHDIFIISDMQQGQADIAQVAADSMVGVYLLPTNAAAMANLFVDSCWFTTPVRLPDQPDNLMVRIRNTGDRAVENLPVKLTVNGTQRAIGTVSLEARSFENVELAFTNPALGIQLLEVSIEDYPVTYDNRYLLSYTVARSVRVMHVRGEDAGNAFPRLLQDDAAFTFSSADGRALDLGSLASNDLVVIDGVRSPSTGLMQELNRFVTEGGHVMVVPTRKADPEMQNELLRSLGAEVFSGMDSTSQRVDRVNLDSDIMRNVFLGWGERIDLPTTTARFRTETQSRSGRENLLTLPDGSPFLSRYPLGVGMTYVLTSPLNDRSTNFHRHALFVPTVYNIALHSARGSVSAETIGSGLPITVTDASERNGNITLVSIGTGERFMPETVRRSGQTAVLVHDQVRTDGHYLLMSGNDTLQAISFNHDRSESDLQHLTAAELKAQAELAGLVRFGMVDGREGTITQAVREMQEGKRLWRLFLVLALVFLGIEILLIRLFR